MAQSRCQVLLRRMSQAGSASEAVVEGRPSGMTQPQKIRQTSFRMIPIECIDLLLIRSLDVADFAETGAHHISDVPAKATPHLENLT
jgi:hypothetical protein